MKIRSRIQNVPRWGIAILVGLAVFLVAESIGTYRAGYFCTRCDYYMFESGIWIVPTDTRISTSRYSIPSGEPVAEQLYEKLGWTTGHDHRWRIMNSGSRSLTITSTGCGSPDREDYVDSERWLLKAATLDVDSVRNFVDQGNGIYHQEVAARSNLLVGSHKDPAPRRR